MKIILKHLFFVAHPIMMGELAMIAAENSMKRTALALSFTTAIFQMFILRDAARNPDEWL